TGLGLAIAREFVRLHGGTIGVGEAPEGGALFTVELPVRAPDGSVRADPAADEPAPAVAAVVDELRTAPASPPPGGAADLPLVLVVEDNLEMNRSVCEILSRDYRTESAFDGREGVTRTLELRPDLVLSDIMMPGLGGDALVREIRALPELDSTPILLLSAR